MRTLGKVFISHSSKDKVFVDRLVSDLQAKEISVWYDKFDLTIGESIPGKINEGIAAAKYFIIVLSPDAVSSPWVREELNAALMKQIASKGTFLIPVLLQDCSIPPLLSHRKHADFRDDYDAGLQELLTVWRKDFDAAQRLGKRTVSPWPNLAVADEEFVYLHSTRFDKFFRMSCELSWTAETTIDHVVSVLELRWNKDVPELGMRWTFVYSLVFDDRKLLLDRTLAEAGVTYGSTLKLGIYGQYEDLYEKELRELWGGGKRYEIVGAMQYEQKLKAAMKARGALTQERLKEMVDSFFSFV